MYQTVLDKYGLTCGHLELQERVKNYFMSFSKQEVFNHTLDVVEEVKMLHQRFEFDLDKCLTAAYLHDIGRVVESKELIHFCESFGHILLKAEEEVPSILHQVASRILATEIFGIKDSEILDALHYHTTLRQFPNQTEMVLFIAEKLCRRESQYQPMILAIQNGIDYSLEYGIYNYLHELHKNHVDIKCYHKYAQEAYGYFKGILNM